MTRHRLAFAGVVLVALVIPAGVMLAASHAGPSCRTDVRSIEWTAGPASRADTLAQGILVLGIHAPQYSVFGDGDRAVGISPLGSVAVRRTPNSSKDFQVLGVTASSDPGCEGKAAREASDRLAAFTSR